MRRECRKRSPRHRLQRKPLVSDPGMHHGTCVTHVPWCMSGSLTRGGGENIPGACTTRNFTYLVRGARVKAAAVKVLTKLSQNITASASDGVTVNINSSEPCATVYVWQILKLLSVPLSERTWINVFTKWWYACVVLAEYVFNFHFYEYQKVVVWIYRRFRRWYTVSQYHFKVLANGYIACRWGSIIDF